MQRTTYVVDHSIEIEEILEHFGGGNHQSYFLLLPFMDIGIRSILLNYRCTTVYSLHLYSYGKCNLSQISCYINRNLNFSLTYLLRFSPAPRLGLGKYPKMIRTAICLSRVSQSPTIINTMGPKEAKTMRHNESSHHSRPSE